MRNLIVLHLCGSNNLLKLQKQQLAIKSLFYKNNIECDTYIFSNEENIYFDNNKFSGCLYYQEFKFLSTIEIKNEILKIENIKKYNNIIFADDEINSNLAVLLALELKYKCVTNVKNINFEQNQIIYTRFAYNNNLLVDYRLNEKCVISLRSFNYKDIEIKKEKSSFLKLKPKKDSNYILSQNIISKSEDLIQSDILLSVGMGVNSKSEIDIMRKFAQENNISFGVTRAVAMRGWAPLSEIIGVSGNIYSPKICVTIGISGAAAFYVGIENSEYIFSININKEAPIINLSNSSLIIDYKKVIDIVLTSLKNR